MKRYPDYVVGIDLSGDPMAGDLFLELLETSRRAGLRIAAHCAEVSVECLLDGLIKINRKHTSAGTE